MGSNDQLKKKKKKEKKKGLEQCFDQLIKKLLSIPILSSDGQ